MERVRHRPAAAPPRPMRFIALVSLSARPAAIPGGARTPVGAHTRRGRQFGESTAGQANVRQAWIHGGSCEQRPGGDRDGAPLEPTTSSSWIARCRYMDGYEATAALRQREAAGTARVPIVALTANAMDEDRRRCLAAGTGRFSQQAGASRGDPGHSRALSHCDRRGAARSTNAARPVHDIGRRAILTDIPRRCRGHGLRDLLPAPAISRDRCRAVSSRRGTASDPHRAWQRPRRRHEECCRTHNRST